MAVVSGLASPDKYPALFETLKKEYHASPYMEKYVLEALFKMGHADFAIERMKSRYAKMLKYDYTTLFEGWGIGSEALWRRHDQPRLEWRPAYDPEPETLRDRADGSRLPDFRCQASAGNFEDRFRRS